MRRDAMLKRGLFPYRFGHSLRVRRVVNSKRCVRWKYRKARYYHCYRNRLISGDQVVTHSGQARTHIAPPRRTTVNYRSLCAPEHRVRHFVTFLNGRIFPDDAAVI